MKLHSLIVIVLLLTFSKSLHAQKHSTLYMRVDSIMRYELNYNVDSANRIERYYKQALQIKDTEPLSLFPLVVLDGLIVDRSELDKYSITSTTKIGVMQAKVATQDFESMAAHGVIAISTNVIKH